MRNEQEQRELDEKVIKMQLRFRAYVAIVWAAVIVFAMLGVMLGHQLGVIIGVVAAVLWVMNRIVNEAIEAWGMLKGIKDYEQRKKDGTGTDDQRPPGPPAAT